MTPGQAWLYAREKTSALRKPEIINYLRSGGKILITIVLQGKYAPAKWYYTTEEYKDELSYDISERVIQCLMRDMVIETVYENGTPIYYEWYSGE